MQCAAQTVLAASEKPGNACRRNEDVAVSRQSQLSQPRRRKYQNGAMADPTIIRMASG